MEKVEVDSQVLESAWRFADAVRPLYDPVGIVLFGSHAKGTSRPGSDIDIAVFVPEVEGRTTNPYRIFEEEFRLLDIACQIDDRIEPHLVEAEHDRSGFSDTIMATGIKLRPNHELAYPDEEIELITD